MELEFHQLTASRTDAGQKRGLSGDYLPLRLHSELQTTADPVIMVEVPCQRGGARLIMFSYSFPPRGWEHGG